jgi:hypothetical protein
LRTTLTMLVHGESGVGKSWLADTVPAPRLILDSEGRAKYTPSGPKIGWDVRTGAPPAYDGTWETCVASVPDFETMTLAYQWLRSGQHHFTSVVVDSLMEIQKRCMDQVAGVNQMQTQDWGTLLRELERVVRGYRDLTLIPTNNTSVVVFIVGSKNSDGKMIPLLQGALRDTVAYYLDVVGYLFQQAVTAADGVTTEFVRSLLVASQPGFVAKDGTGRLPGPIIQSPNIAQLVELLHVNGKPEGLPEGSISG